MGIYLGTVNGLDRLYLIGSARVVRTKHVRLDECKFPASDWEEVIMQHNEVGLDWIERIFDEQLPAQKHLAESILAHENEESTALNDVQEESKDTSVREREQPETELEEDAKEKM